jgi:hypothetical protein
VPASAGRTLGLRALGPSDTPTGLCPSQFAEGVFFGGGGERERERERKKKKKAYIHMKEYEGRKEGIKTW